MFSHLSLLKLFPESSIQPIMKILKFVFIFLFVSFGFSYAQDKSNKEQFTAWITQNAHRIKTVDAGNDFDDLQPFKSVLKDVRVVGLGEATHGTSEFFRMKHRMLEFLVKEMGFTSFYIEASMSRCYYINDYILFGKGNLDSATFVQGFVPWRVEEVRDMIQWMRNYNVAAPEKKKIRFYGFDLQINDRAWDELKDFYKTLNEKKIVVLDSLQQKMDSASKLSNNMENQGKGASLFNEVYKDVLGLLDDIVMNQGEYEYKVGSKEYQRNLMNIKLITQETESYKNLILNLRDYYMAQNILHLLNREGDEGKAVVWAHNGHVSKGWGLMGSYLSKVLKDKYYAVGFEFYSGSFQSRNQDLKNKSPNWDIVTVKEPPVNSLAWYLNKTGMNNLFLDFRNTGTDRVKNFSKNYGMHSFGSAYSASWPLVYPSKLKDYDGLIFIRNTTAAKNFVRDGITPF